MNTGGPCQATIFAASRISMHIFMHQKTHKKWELLGVLLRKDSFNGLGGGHLGAVIQVGRRSCLFALLSKRRRRGSPAGGFAAHREPGNPFTASLSDSVPETQSDFSKLRCSGLCHNHRKDTSITNRHVNGLMRTSMTCLFFVRHREIMPRRDSLSITAGAEAKHWIFPSKGQILRHDFFRRAFDAVSRG